MTLTQLDPDRDVGMTGAPKNAMEPVAEDLSAWVMSGRVRTEDVPLGLDEAVEAERLGFRRVFLSERYNLKEAGVLLGGIGARTSRLGLGTGVVALRTRHPLMMAAMGATLHAAFGSRFVLGIGRSDPKWAPSHRDDAVSYTELIDYIDILKRLWRGETVTYRGPAGTFENLALGEVYDGPSPEVWVGSLGGPAGVRAVAASDAVDGVMLWDMMTLDASRAAIARIRTECERVGRDPSSLRICQPVITAPDVSDDEVRALTHARMVTYLGWEPGVALVKTNGWDTGVVERVRSHPLLSGLPPEAADLGFHRSSLMDVARLVPDSWMDEACAIGTAAQCVARLQEYRDAGADEIATYGSSPVQNAGVIRLWRTRSGSPHRRET
jgi:probable F420-dependent oxidoreductase